MEDSRPKVACPKPNRLVVKDENTNEFVLIAPDAQVSLFPRFNVTRKAKQKMDSKVLINSVGSILKTYGYLTRTLDFGLGQEFTWTFKLVNNCERPVIGRDFLSRHKLKIDFDKMCLINPETGLESKRILLPACECHQDERISDGWPTVTSIFERLVVHRFHVTDLISDKLFLISEESQISVIPKSATRDESLLPFDGSIKLGGVFGESTQIQGWTILTVDFGTGRAFNWQFAVIDCDKPIIGRDFLKFFGLIIQFKNGFDCFYDTLSGYSTIPPTCPCDCGSIREGWPANPVITVKNISKGKNQTRTVSKRKESLDVPRNNLAPPKQRFQSSNKNSESANENPRESEPNSKPKRFSNRNTIKYKVSGKPTNGITEERNESKSGNAQEKDERKEAIRSKRHIESEKSQMKSPGKKHRFHVRDKNTNLPFLIGSDVAISVFPRSRVEEKDLKPFDGSFELVDAAGEIFHILGWTKLVLDIGLRKQFSWNFAVIDINKPILGTDFLCHYELSLQEESLTDPETNRTTAPPSGPCDCGKPVDGWPSPACLSTRPVSGELKEKINSPVRKSERNGEESARAEEDSEKSSICTEDKKVSEKSLTCEENSGEITEDFKLDQQTSMKPLTDGDSGEMAASKDSGESQTCKEDIGEIDTCKKDSGESGTCVENLEGLTENLTSVKRSSLESLTDSGEWATSEDSGESLTCEENITEIDTYKKDFGESKTCKENPEELSHLKPDQKTSQKRILNSSLTIREENLNKEKFAREDDSGGLTTSKNSGESSTCKKKIGEIDTNKKIPGESHPCQKDSGKSSTCKEDRKDSGESHICKDNSGESTKDLKPDEKTYQKSLTGKDSGELATSKEDTGESGSRKEDIGELDTRRKDSGESATCEENPGEFTEDEPDKKTTECDKISLEFVTDSEKNLIEEEPIACKDDSVGFDTCKEDSEDSDTCIVMSEELSGSTELITETIDSDENSLELVTDPSKQPKSNDDSGEFDTCEEDFGDAATCKEVPKSTEDPESIPEAESENPLEPINKHRLHVVDKNTNLLFYIDTETRISVFPKSQLGERKLEKLKNSYEIIDDEGVVFPIYGWTPWKLDFGLGREFTWNFAVTDVDRPIISRNFNKFFGLEINPEKQTLFWSETGIATSTSSGPCDCEKLDNGLPISKLIKIRRVAEETKDDSPDMETDSYVMNGNSGEEMLFSDADASFFPRCRIPEALTETLKKEPVQVQGVLIYGYVTVKFNYGSMKKVVEWKFGIADVDKVIFGRGFLEEPGFRLMTNIEFGPTTELLPTQEKQELKIRCELAAEGRCQEERRMILVNKETGIPYMFSTGVVVSVFPKSKVKKDELEAFDNSFDLVDATGSIVQIFGWTTRKIDFGLGRYFEWKFAVVNVGMPIIGSDFLHKFGFTMTMSNKINSLFDKITGKTVTGSKEFCECQAKKYWPDAPSMTRRPKKNPKKTKKKSKGRRF